MVFLASHKVNQVHHQQNNQLFNHRVAFQAFHKIKQAILKLSRSNPLIQWVVYQVFLEIRQLHHQLFRRLQFIRVVFQVFLEIMQIQLNKSIRQLYHLVVFLALLNIKHPHILQSPKQPILNLHPLIQKSIRHTM